MTLMSGLEEGFNITMNQMILLISVPLKRYTNLKNTN